MEAKSQICFFKMFTESEQWEKKTIAAKMMNGFGGLRVFLPVDKSSGNEIIAVRQHHQELSQTNDLSYCKPGLLSQISISQMGLITLLQLKVI